MSTTSYISTLLAIRYKYDFNPKENRYFCPTYFFTIGGTRMYKEDA